MDNSGAASRCARIAAITLHDMSVAIGVTVLGKQRCFWGPRSFRAETRHRRVSRTPFTPNRIDNPEADESAIHQVYCIFPINRRVVQTARLWRDSNREQELAQAGPDQAFGCNRRTAEIGIERANSPSRLANIVDHLPDLAQRRSGGHAILKTGIAEQRPAGFIRAGASCPPTSLAEKESCSQIAVQKRHFQHPANGLDR